MPPLVIPVFIPHQGCPHRCVFCNQDAITGSGGTAVDADAVRETIAEWLARPRRPGRNPVQVAFYGGSFTGLPAARQEALLAAVRPFLVAGTVQDIRLSTRPDYVDAATPVFLQSRGVGIVELGVQSLDDRVLAASNRGHTAGQVHAAAAFLQKNGIRLGVQLMLGLPGQTTKSFLATVAETIRIGPDFVRLYPALVVRNSGLARLFADGSYRPLSLARAIGAAVLAKEMLDRAGIPVLRLGLQPTSGLTEQVIAGPYHPAFGEQVLSRQFFLKARKLLAVQPNRKVGWKLLINPADESICRGPANRNLKKLAVLAGGIAPFLTRVPQQKRHTVFLAPGQADPMVQDQPPC